MHSLPIRRLPALVLPFAALLFAACSKPQSSTAAPQTSLPERFHLAAEPSGAQPVAAVRANAKDGDAVVVVGAVGGSSEPFVSGAAAFTLVDPALKSCAGDDMSCETPWDYCCADPKTLAASTATVEFRDGGAVLPAAPRGFHGLDHLKTVVVKGTAQRDEQGNLTIVAEGVYVRS